MLPTKTAYTLVLRDRATLECETLDEALEAASKADLDFESTTIEKDGIKHPINDWIVCRVAGGHCNAG